MSENDMSPSTRDNSLLIEQVRFDMKQGHLTHADAHELCDELEEAADRIRSLEGTVRSLEAERESRNSLVLKQGLTIESLRTRLAEAEKDAERYRHIFAGLDDDFTLTRHFDSDSNREEVLWEKSRTDKLIDAAMAALASGRVKEGDR